MPTQTYPYLVLTDGTTTVTFQNGSGTPTNWQLELNGWAPAIPAINPSVLAARGQYGEVTETLSISVRGSTAADCYTNLGTLAQLLEQAERWWLGENVSPVLFKCAPQGSTVSSTAAPLQAAVIGRATGDGTSGVSLSPQWNEAGLFFEIAHVQVKFVRRSPWLLASGSAASGATNNGSIALVTMAATQNVPGPTKISMSNYPASAADRGFLILSSNYTPNYLVLANPSTMTAANWTTVNDAGNFAQYTNVLRYTPVATTESTSGTLTLLTAVSGAPLVAVFANVRNNSAATNFFLRAQVWAGANIAGYTTLNYIPATAAATPGWVLLGFVALPQAATHITFLATASGAAGSLDISAVALVDVSYSYTYVLGYSPALVTAAVKAVECDPSMLVTPEPITSITTPFTIEGDMMIFSNQQGLHLVNLCCSGGANDWRQTSGGAVTTNTFTLTRYSAYLAPI